MAIPRLAALLIPVLLIPALLIACGSTEKTSVTNVLVSPEQQRADLQRARDLGIIDEQEYQQELSEIGQ